MLVIVRNCTKKRINIGIKVLIALFLVSLIISHLYNSYQGTNVIKEGWLRDDSPSGNPMRVENIRQSENINTSPDVLDKFVVKLRDLYQKDE
jgi:hypothetical protein